MFASSARKGESKSSLMAFGCFLCRESVVPESSFFMSIVICWLLRQGSLGGHGGGSTLCSKST